MKVTVAFGDMKIVVPCGAGDLSIKELAAKAVYRVKNSLKLSSDVDRILVHSFAVSRDGGILDWDDLVCDVLDDREQLVAQYSIQVGSLDPLCTKTPSLKHVPIAPLIFDTTRIPPPGRHAPCDQPGGIHGNTGVATGSSSSSLSLSSGSLGAGGGGGCHHPTVAVATTSHPVPKLPATQASASSTSSPSSVTALTPRCHPSPECHQLSQHHHQLFHERPLKEIEIPPIGLLDDQNKADSGYKSDHTRVFCDIVHTPHQQTRTPPTVDHLRQTVMTPPLPPPIVTDCDISRALISASTPTTTAGTITHISSPNFMEGGPSSASRFEFQFPGSATPVRPINPKFAEALLRRRVHLRSSWDDCADDEDIEEEDEEENGEDDDFMEVADAIKGKWPLQQHQQNAMMVASSATATTDGEGGDFSDEGLSTVRRVVLQPKIGEEGPVAAPRDLEKTPISSQNTSPKRGCSNQITSALDSIQCQPKPAAPGSAIKAKHGAVCSQSHQLPSSSETFQPVGCAPSTGPPQTLPDEIAKPAGVASNPRLTSHPPERPKPNTTNSDLIGGANGRSRHKRDAASSEEKHPEEDVTTEEDYPMLRLDYRLREDREQTPHHTRGPPKDSGQHVVGPTAALTAAQLPPPPASSQLPLASQSRATTTHRGLATPAVLQWLEATQAATAADETPEGIAMFPFPTLSSVGSGASSVAAVVSVAGTGCGGVGAAEEETISASQHDLVSRVIRRDVREASENLRRDFYLAGGYQSTVEPVEIRLTNPSPGENLGIQIKPVFTKSTEIIPFVGQIPPLPNSNGKCEAGLEVHAIMPNGRIAREGALHVGDQILSINGTPLMGVPFDKGREIFQEALNKPELLLRVLPYAPQMPTTDGPQPIPSTPLAAAPPSSTIDSVAPVTREIGGPGSLSPPPPSKPSCGLVLVVDRTDKAKEGGASGRKQTPPSPPPRRSSHLALAQAQGDGGVSSAVKAPPVLPPRQKVEVVQAQVSASGVVTKTIRLRKGASGLGFSLTSRDQHQRKPNCPVFIKNILPGGAALVDGNLKPGDRLLTVDERDVSSMGQSATVSYLREQPIGSLVTIVVSPIGHHHHHYHQQQHQHNEHKSQQLQRQHQMESSTPAATSNDEEDSLRNFAVDPSLVHVLTFDIQISNVSVGTAEEADELKSALDPSAGPIPTALLASAFTLGVSVRVREITTDDCSAGCLEAAMKPAAAASSLSATSSSQDSRSQNSNSKNGVFVRTVIPGGAAHKDGQLRVGDRLLAIDNRPLSCLASSDALHLLKTSIARITADKESFVRLLVARRREPAGEDHYDGGGVDDELNDLLSARRQPPCTTGTLRRRLAGSNSSPNLRKSSGPNSGSLDSLLTDAAIRLNSFVVSADVHQTANDSTNVSSDNYSSQLPSTSTANRGTQQHLSAFTRNHTVKKCNGQSTALRKCTSEDTLAGNAAIYLAATATATNNPTTTSNDTAGLIQIEPGNSVTKIPSVQDDNEQQQPEPPSSIHPSSSTSNITFATASSVVRPGQIYRCDSQGTVNTSALSDSGSTTPTLTDTSDLVHFSSDSSGYEVLATTTTAKINDGLGSFSVHAECGGGALSEPETLPTLLRRRRNQQHCHHRHRRRPSRRYQRTLVVVKQPKIDLEKMMVVPFSNKTPVSMADPGALESVAVQTSPPGEEKKPGTIAKEGASRRRASSQSGIGSMFRGKIKPLNRLETPDSSRHPSESALKKLFRFVRPTGRSHHHQHRNHHANCNPPAARIFSGRTLDRGTVAYFSSTNPSNLSVSSNSIVALHPTLYFLPSACRSPSPIVSNNGDTLPVDNNDNNTVSPRRTAQPRLVSIVGERPQPLVHRTWNPIGGDIYSSRIAAGYEGFSENIRSSAHMGLCRPLSPPTRLPFHADARRPLSPHPAIASVLLGPPKPPQSSTTSKTVGTGGSVITAASNANAAAFCAFNGGNYVALDLENHNYADLEFPVMPGTRAPFGGSVRGPFLLSPGESVDSTVAFIPPPMAPMSLKKLKSVLSSYPQPTKSGADETATAISVGNNKYTINQLYDMDLSSCSTAYESVAQMATSPQDVDVNDPTFPKIDRNVYEDAEALYRHLSRIRGSKEIPENSNASPPSPPNSVTSNPHTDAT